jgi:hypothetical protein
MRGHHRAAQGVGVERVDDHRRGAETFSIAAFACERVDEVT